MKLNYKYTKVIKAYINATFYLFGDFFNWKIFKNLNFMFNEK